jgi:predicted ATPase/transcriptional regulator with XRE-family HTH domain
VEDFTASFGEWLRARRKALDLTQFELAARAGCAEDTIGRIEAGTRRPSRQVAALLADALGVPATAHADFIRFAREGGARPAPARRARRGAEGTKPRPVAAVSPPPPPHPAVWVPYLTSLPQSPTPLIGRADELAAATRMLRSGQTRLLTLTGPPGVGKTRLALAVAAALTPAFPDGICFVPLAPLRDPALLALTVAQALGITDNPGGPQAARLLAFLRPKRLLLVLDNFEHLVEATPRVAEWLNASTHLHVLVTSRSTLQVRREHLFPVAPLPVPQVPSDEPSRMDLTALGAYPAVALFVERAQAVDPVFRLTEANAPVVAELCARMEGLPLALELTAARSARLAPELVLARLARRLDVVTHGPRDLPPHQRTLRATIAWSYDLLSPPERLLFARMAVFAGGVTLDALEIVCNAQDDIAGGPTGALEGLVQQSLVYRVRAAEAEAAPSGSRFSMLETLHEYAWERLRESGDAEELQHRHALYFLALAEEATSQLKGSREGWWLDRLETEHDNLRTALAWAQAHHARELGLRLVGALGRFWAIRGHASEGRRWIAGALALAPVAAAPLRAQALFAAGQLASNQGDYEAARAAYEASLALWREPTADPAAREPIGKVLMELGMLAYFQGEYATARRLLEESRALLRIEEHRFTYARVLESLATVLCEQGDFTTAQALYEEGLRLFQGLGVQRGIAVSLSNLGMVAQYQGQYERARQLFETAAARFGDMGDLRKQALTYSNLGIAALEQGDYGAAQSYFVVSLRPLWAVRDKWGVAYCLEGLAGVSGGQGQWERAARLFGAAAGLRESLQAPLAPAERGQYERSLAVARAQGDPARWEAAWAEGQALPLAQMVVAALEGNAALGATVPPAP